MPRTYRVRVQGLMDPAWSEWLGGLTITHEPTGQSVLAGPLADQAAVYGVLLTLADLAVPLLSVAASEDNWAESDQAAGPA